MHIRQTVSVSYTRVTCWTRFVRCCVAHLHGTSHIMMTARPGRRVAIYAPEPKYYILYNANRADASDASRLTNFGYLDQSHGSSHRSPTVFCNSLLRHFQCISNLLSRHLTLPVHRMTTNVVPILPEPPIVLDTFFKNRSWEIGRKI